ncbi:MAG: SDR family NAD(P)-dependent oxidoreductase [Acidimicrobiales bacterium]
MSRPVAWVTGASSGIGAALVTTCPWSGARLIGLSRRPPPPPAEHLALDLADPSSWTIAAASFADAVATERPDRVVLFHAAGTLDPIGFAGRVDSNAYTAGVLLNSAAPQVLGHVFLAATVEVGRRHLVLLTSGAATTVYPGTSSYGAAKAAADQWVRTVGAEQSGVGIGTGAQVLAVAPGTVATSMQDQLRAAPEADFPPRQRFRDLLRDGQLSDPDEVAIRLWALLDGDLKTGSVVDLRHI